MFDEIKELKTLLDEGLITQEDYDQKKSKILASLATPVTSGNPDGAGAPSNRARLTTRKPQKSLRHICSSVPERFACSSACFSPCPEKT